jgi:hypothetical protein
VGAALAAAGVGGALSLGALFPLLEIEAPRPRQVARLAGVEVVVRFPGRRVAPETLRALLNGADVTAGFVTGENGAYGRLHALLEGENVIRVEVFGRPLWWEGLFVEQAREVRVVHRPPLDLNRG